MSKRSLKSNMSQNQLDNKRAIEALENVIYHHQEQQKRKKESYK